MLKLLFYFQKNPCTLNRYINNREYHFASGVAFEDKEPIHKHL